MPPTHRFDDPLLDPPGPVLREDAIEYRFVAIWSIADQLRGAMDADDFREPASTP